MTVIERIQRGIFSLEKDGYEPFEIELIGDDWDALHAAMEAGGPLVTSEATKGWPTSVLGVPFSKVQTGKSAVIARRQGIAARASFFI